MSQYINVENTFTWYKNNRNLLFQLEKKTTNKRFIVRQTK